MKKLLPMIFLVIVSLLLSGCNFIQEQRAKSFIKKYYQAIIDQNYEKAFEQLHLYDHKLNEGTVLSDTEAKEFFLEKVKVLDERKYRLKDYHILEVEYEDGHSFWHQIKLEAEVDGQPFEWNEVAHLYAEKLLLGGYDDPYVKFRDGRMNFDIAKELENRH